MRKIKSIVIHHSASADHDTYDWSDIREYHMRVRGWRDIGYHAGIEFVRGSYEALVGRAAWMDGAHAGNVRVNHESLGFVFIGNYSLETPHEDMLATAAHRVLVPWMHTYGLTPDAMIAHREIKPTECPGLKFDLEVLRALCWKEYNDTLGKS